MDITILKNLLSNQFGVPVSEITDDTCVITDLGADSIDIVEIIMNLEKTYNIKIEDEEVAEKTTIHLLQEFIDQKIKHM